VIELRGLDGFYKKFGLILDVAFEKYLGNKTETVKPEICWRRLLVLGDSKHGVLVALQPHLKSIQSLQKGLNSLQLKVMCSLTFR
jgi:hypothetical protein